MPVIRKARFSNLKKKQGIKISQRNLNKFSVSSLQYIYKNCLKKVERVLYSHKKDE